MTSHSPEAQAVALNGLLTKQYLDCIIKIHEKSTKSEIEKALDYTYAIALYNKHKLNDARNVFANLYEAYHEPDYRFFYLCADIQIKNIEYGIGTKEYAESLQNSLNDLLQLRKQAVEAYSNNERLVAVLELQSYYNMSSIDSKYLDTAVDAYNNYSESIQRDTQILYYLGVCYELMGNSEKAISIYKSANWNDDENVAYRLIACLIRQNRIEEAKDKLRQVKSNGVPIESLNLYIQYITGNEQYNNNLKETIAKYYDSFDDLLTIIYYINDPDIFTDCAKDLLTDKIKNCINDLDESKCNALLLILIKNKQLDLVYSIISQICSIYHIDGYIAYQLYLMLFDITGRENKRGKKVIRLSHDLEVSEKIADLFIEHNLFLKYFLQVKIECLNIK